MLDWWKDDTLDMLEYGEVLTFIIVGACLFIKRENSVRKRICWDWKREGAIRKKGEESRKLWEVCWQFSSTLVPFAKGKLWMEMRRKYEIRIHKHFPDTTLWKYKSWNKILVLMVIGLTFLITISHSTGKSTDGLKNMFALRSIIFKRWLEKQPKIRFLSQNDRISYLHRLLLN